MPLLALNAIIGGISIACTTAFCMQNVGLHATAALAAVTR
jgi:hypothetical protein